MQKHKNAAHLVDFLKSRKSEQNTPGPVSSHPAPERHPEDKSAATESEKFSSKDGKSSDEAVKEVHSANEDEKGTVFRGRSRPAPGFASRGKGLMLKYDVAMLVLLALAGMVVIAFLWGYHAGRNARHSERQGASAPALEKDAYSEPAGPVETPAHTDSAGGDAATEPQYYALRIMADPHYDEQRKERYESIAEKLKSEGLDAKVVTDGEMIFLFVGRIRKKDSPEAKRLKERFMRDYPTCFWVQQ